MERARRWGVRLAAAAVVCLTAWPARAELGPLALELVTRVPGSPVGVTHAGDGSGRLFILERSGRVFVHPGDPFEQVPFLDIRDRVGCCGRERGLFGLAFHPDYKRNGYFYVSYTGRDDLSVVSRFSVSSDPDRAVAGSELRLLEVVRPDPQHNVGHLAFGPDGYLYIGSGDGSCCGDPDGNAQDLGSLLGKILRIDVDRGSGYAVPPDNPFVDVAGARGEVWAYGLRNPWRFSFDRRTGDLYIGDVGHDGWEEIDFQRASSRGGENYGWPLMEGGSCFRPAEGCDDGTLTPPILEYPHRHAHDGEEDGDSEGPGCASVTGGFRYRGPPAATLPRFYLFGDFCAGRVWGARRNASGGWLANELLASGLLIVSFGEDERGRLYLIDFLGAVYRLIGRPSFASGFEDGLDGWLRQGPVGVVSPGLGGSSAALEVPLGRRGPRAAVRSEHADGESTFRVSFELDPNRADLGGRPHEILRLVDVGPHVKLRIQPGAAGYHLVLEAHEPAGFRRVGLGGIPASATVRLALEWSRASSREAADGELKLWRNGRLIGSATDLANHGRAVSAVVLGLPEGSGGAGGGSLLFDNYLSMP